MHPKIAVVVALFLGACGSGTADTGDTPTPAEAIASLPTCEDAIANSIPDGFNGCMDGGAVIVAPTVGCEGGDDVVTISPSSGRYAGTVGGTFERTDATTAELCG